MKLLHQCLHIVNKHWCSNQFINTVIYSTVIFSSVCAPGSQPAFWEQGGGRHFPQILGIFQGLKIGSCQWLSRGNLWLMMLLWHDICLMKYGSHYGWIGTIQLKLWSKLESTWYVYSIFTILFHRWTILKMLVLERSAEKWTFLVPWGVRPLRPPLATGLCTEPKQSEQ